MDRIRIGISACLLGDEVRYDGGHKRNPFLADVLGPRVDWVRVCPEVEVGMGTPREPVRLVRAGGGLHMVTVRTQVDYTAVMTRWAETRIEALASERLSGFVFKADSPSCGIEGVKVHEDGGGPAPPGRGLFADALMRRFPELPVEDEARLGDADVRERFLERVLAYHRRLAQKLPTK